MTRDCDFSELKGQIIVRILIDQIPIFGEFEKQGEEVCFITKENKHYFLKHFFSCCEVVRLEEVHGNLDDILDTEIIEASEEIIELESEGIELCEATFYKIATVKGHVTLRWVGTSNGYYSVGVDFFTYTKDSDRRAYGYI